MNSRLLNFGIFDLPNRCKLFSLITLTSSILGFSFENNVKAQGYFLSNFSTSQVSGELSVGTSFSGWQFVAQPFTTGQEADGTYLTGVQVQMKDFLLGTEGLFMRLFDNFGGVPGAPLTELEGNWEEGLQNFTPRSPVMLEGGKDYFLVLGSDPTEEAIFRVVTVNSGNSRGQGKIDGNISIINNSIGNWQELNGSEAFSMGISSTTVPEPASIALILAGAGIFFRKFRR